MFLQVFLAFLTPVAPYLLWSKLYISTRQMHQLNVALTAVSPLACIVLRGWVLLGISSLFLGIHMTLWSADALDSGLEVPNEFERAAPDDSWGRIAWRRAAPGLVKTAAACGGVRRDEAPAKEIARHRLDTPADPPRCA